MIKPRILVTGATGKTGRIVVAELLSAGYPVRAMVHREDGRSAQLRLQGAEIAVADMSDVERVADALNDVQGAYYCPPFDPYMIQGATGFAVAANEAHLEHIVGMTQWLASPSHPALMTRQHWLVDQVVFDDARSRLHGRAAGLLRRRLPGTHWRSGESRSIPLDLWRQPQRAAFERRHRASRCICVDGSRAARRKELPPHRPEASRRAGDGQWNRPRGRTIGQGRADAGLDVHEGGQNGRLPNRSAKQHSLLHRRP